ncbi:hypothetical protein TWF481_008825 [Arthrobotrys musiformis]|uniref:Clr5 domain-containing protein n=1 Tax=Arthrobotrys musiformis TaxID=47236 RepID=A0AAV9WA29_9PEZI
MDYTVHEYQGGKVPRVYHKMQDLEPYKASILQKHEAGIKQKDLRAFVKGVVGFDPGASRLKRILDKWGVSKANLTKARKAHIYKIVNERRRRKKIDPKVTLQHKGQSKRLSKEEVDEIMDMAELVDVKPDPIGMELCTPTPGASSGPDDCPYSTYVHGDIGALPESAMETDEEMTEGQGKGENPIIVHGIDDEAVQLEPPRPEETIEQLQEVIVRELKAAGIQDTTPEIDLDDDFLDVLAAKPSHTQTTRVALRAAWVRDQMNLSNDLLNIHHLVRRLRRPVHHNYKGELDWKNPILRQYALKYKHKYLRAISWWKSFVETRVGDLKPRRCRPREGHDEMGSVQHSRGIVLHLPHEFRMAILQTDAQHKPEAQQNGGKEDEECGRRIICCVEQIFDYFIVNHRKPFDHLITFLGSLFTRNAIHLPRLISTYGAKSFLVARWLDQLLHRLYNYSPKFFGPILPPLADYTIEIHEHIGIENYPDLLCRCYFSLGECEGRDRVLQRLSRNYGRRHPTLVRKDIYDARQTISRSGYQHDPIRQKTVAELLTRICENFEYSWQDILPCFGTTEMCMELVALFDRLSASDVVKFEAPLRNSILHLNLPPQDPTFRAFHGSANIAFCTFALGSLHARAKDFTRSLEMLLRAYRMLTDRNDIVTRAFGREVTKILSDICKVVDARGPVLYVSLQPIFFNCYSYILGNQRFVRERRRVQQLWAKCKAIRKESLSGEYSRVLARRPRNRTSTPDLQSWFYYDSLETWLYSQGDFPTSDADGIELGGQAMEF